MESTNRHHELEAQDDELPTTRRPPAQLRPAPVSKTAGSRKKTVSQRRKIGGQSELALRTTPSTVVEGEEINNTQLVTWTRSERDTSRLMAGQPANTFTCFSRLPPEIRNLIWSWAAVIIPARSPRVLSVAPDPEDLEFEPISAVLNQQLRICPGVAFSNPELLTACRDARLVALKEYTVWGLAAVKTHVPLRGAAYINKTFDHVYFRSMSDFHFLNLLKDVDYLPTHRNEDGNFNVPILRQLLAQFNGIQNLAMTWEQWHLLIDDGHDIQWLRHLPPLKVLTIVLTLRIDDMMDRIRVPFAPRLCLVERGTLRAVCGEKIRWWTQKCLDLFSQQFPEYPIPKVRVRQLPAPPIDHTSSDDIQFDQEFDKDYRLEGKRHFGKMPRFRLVRSSSG